MSAVRVFKVRRSGAWMNPRARRVSIISIILLLLSAAAAQNSAQPPRARDAPPNASTVALSALPDGTRSLPSAAAALARLPKDYDAAVERVSVWRNEDVRKLKPLTAAEDGTVEVATANDAYKYPVTSPLYGDTWVTIVPELLNACREFTGDVTMKVRQLLGLPPDKQIPTIVVMKVQATDVFRPTPDPTPWTLCPCGNPSGDECNFAPEVQCGNRFPKDVAPAHVQWIAENTLKARQVPGGYPWTHLGYTYNWKRDADPYGASEYIVRKGASVTDVKTVALEDYCRQ